MLSSVARLLEAWNHGGVDYCHWKSTVRLEKAVRGETDIDVLVSAEDADAAERIADEEGFHRCDTVPLRSYPGITDYVCLDESGTWAHVHLHYQLVLGDRWAKAYWLPVEEAVLERAPFREEIDSPVVSAQDELYLFCARMALKFRRPFSRSIVREEYEHILSRLDPDEWENPSYPTNVPALDGLVDHARSSALVSSADLNKHARRARRSLRRIRRLGPVSHRLQSATRAVYRYWIEFRRRISDNFEIGRRRIPEGGSIVALVGIDGSGKSTLVRRMEELFGEQMNVTRVFLGNGRSGASWYRKAAFSVFGTRASLRRHRALREGEERESGDEVPWYYALWILLCVVDKRADLRRAMAARANGSLVLSDRWPQDQVPGTHDGPRLNGMEGLTGLARHAAESEAEFIRDATRLRPELVIKLKTSPEVACARKPDELTEAEAREYARSLEEIDWSSRQVRTVDADRPLEAVEREVRDAIWNVVRRAG